LFFILKKKHDFLQNKNDPTAFLNEAELQEARQKRLHELRIKQAIREISLYFCFIFVVFFVSYTNTGTSAYDYQASLRQRFELPEDVRSVEEFWKWTLDSMASNLRATVWYNGQQPYGLGVYFEEKNMANIIFYKFIFLFFSLKNMIVK
jgi:hypothetical protein